MAFRTDFVTQSRRIVPRVSRASSSLNRTYPGLLAGLGFAALLLVSAPALSQVAPDLGEAFDFTVLGTKDPATSGTVTCTNSTINGDVGSTGGITNIGCTFNGDNTAPVDASVVDDFDGAFGALNTANPTCDTLNGTLAGQSPVPGVYCIDPSGKTGTLTLSGNASDVWVFKSNGDAGLAGTNFNVVMGGTADACNVYWWSEAGAAMTTSNFKGTILAGADITVTGGIFDGRTQATGDVTMTDATLNFAGCAAPATITVNKDFIPDNPASVEVDLECTSGTVETTPLDASEAAPAVFTVGAADPDAICTATETVPEGYTADQTDCEEVELDGSCTIINTLDDNTIVVNKDFIPDSAATVSVDLTCTSGMVTETPQDAAEGAPAVFTVDGALEGATCTATETVPDGFTADQTDCENVPLGGSCTITNTLIPPPQPDAIAIPALSGWAMIMLAAFLAIFSFAVMRRQPR